MRYYQGLILGPVEHTVYKDADNNFVSAKVCCCQLSPHKPLRSQRRKVNMR